MSREERTKYAPPRPTIDVVQFSTVYEKKAAPPASGDGVVQISAAVAIAQLAGRQRGTVGRRQLVALGLPDAAIARWVKQGRLHRLYWGIYLVGHAVPAPLALEQGALLACGDGSVLSHFTAAFIHGLLPRASGPVHVTTLRHRGRPKGVVVHTSRRLEPRDTARRHNLRVTTVPRTLLDLAECADGRTLERAVETAFAQRRTTEPQLRALIARSPGRRGAGRLEALLDFRGNDGYSRSAAEDLTRRLLRRARLPQPAVNATIEGHEVDFTWVEQRVIVEVDSWTHHSGRAQFEYDRSKAADLQAAGYTVMRVTWRQLTTEPEATVARIAAALALASA